MSATIFIRCDKPGCGQGLSAGFDDVLETWGDMLAALEAAGWRAVDPRAPSRQARLLCPDHAKEDPCALPPLSP